jgi:hypothetical protein
MNMFHRGPRRYLGLMLLLVAILLAVSFGGCSRANDADTEYEQAVEQMDTIHAYLADRELHDLTPEDLDWLESEFVILADRIERMDDLSSLPLGLGRVAEFGSSTYRSTREMLDVARLLAESGQIIANVGNEALTALDEQGIQRDPGSDGETWLDVIQRRDAELDEALAIMHEALELRAELEEDDLPGRVQGNLWKIDEMIGQVESQLELADQRIMAYEALGGDGPRRYLILFQNPAELRPTGGFVGTIAELELERGQISDYTFQDVYEISQAYNNSSHSLEAPVGIAQFVRADKLQFQDANWWADFPVSAELLMEMADAAGWGEFDGVAAIQPEVIQDMLSVTGPISIDVDGETREISADNLQGEAERQRILARQGEEVEAGHKEVIGLIGEELFETLASSDRETMVPGVMLVFERLDRRDMQAFHTDTQVQTYLEQKNWAGRLIPDPELPTLSVIVSNVTGLKTSLAMQPAFNLELLEGESPNTTDATLTLSLTHTGEAGGDPFYEGFQRYWIDVGLPEGAILVDSEGRAANDPDSGTGGAYIVSLDVGETQEVRVQFTMPAEDSLLLRRQPGLTIAQVTVDQTGCADSPELWLYRDHTIQFDTGCPVVASNYED